MKTDMLERKDSKLVTYINVLKVLRNQGPSNITSMMVESHINSMDLTKCLDFLVS